MWAANLNQVFKKNPSGKEYDCWLLFLRHGSDTKIEKSIRDKHEKIDTLLREQNVNYTEITTHSGKKGVYDKFGFRNGKHPLFLIFNKHPRAYQKGESLMVIEWGKWKDVEELKEHLMALVNFFSDEEFREKIREAKDQKRWAKVGTFLEKHGITLLKIGVSIAAAL